MLGIRDFRLLLADRVLAPASFAFSLVGVSFAVLDATHGSTAKLSYVLAAQIAPSLAFLLLGGVIADRMAPQKVIIAGNIMMAAGEGTFGILVLTGHPPLWQMIALESLTGIGMAIFYPASSALLPRLVPGELLQEASAVSRLAMNGAQMGGAVLAGFVVAVTGPGWALAVCGTGLLGTVPLMLSMRVSAPERAEQPAMLRELREGWSEFRSHTWLWVIVAQYAVVLMAWYGSFSVLGPVVARAHLGGPAAWGTITGAESLGLIAGGLISLRFSPRRPMLFVAALGATIAYLATLAGHAVAVAGHLRRIVRLGHGHGDHDGAVDGGTGPQHPGGQASQSIVLRRVRLDHGHARRRGAGRADRRMGRSVGDPVRCGGADRPGLGAGPDPARHQDAAG